MALTNVVRYGLLTIPLVVLLTGCATAPSRPEQVPAEIEMESKLPVPDLVLTYEGLGPSNDEPDREFMLSSKHPVTVLVHGCRGSAGRFGALAQVLAFHGQQSVCFSYNSRDSLMRTSRDLAAALEWLAAQLETPDITVIGHSQGGLVARKALVSDRPSPIDAECKLTLVTISAPFSGIRAARFCSMPLIRIATLGLHDLVSWILVGAKWYEITPASDFINVPGSLVPAVERYLLVATDERDTCRTYDADGQCAKDDYVFSLGEQAIPSVDTGVEAEIVVVKAGHVEIVGDSGIIPHKLIDVLQEEGVVGPTEPSRSLALRLLLHRLYDAHVL